MASIPAPLVSLLSMIWPCHFSAAKLDEDTGDYHVDRVSFDFAKCLQKARLDKKLTQTELAQQVNERTSVINDYEAGRVSALSIFLLFQL